MIYNIAGGGKALDEKAKPPSAVQFAWEVSAMILYKKILIGLLVLAALVAGWLLLRWQVVIID